MRTFQGWIYCRDNPDDCVDYVLGAGIDARQGPPGLADERGQPADLAVPERIGITDKALWDQTIKIAKEGGVLTADPAEGAYRNDLAQKALDGIKEDAKGTSFKKGTATPTEGGN